MRRSLETRITGGVKYCQEKGFASGGPLQKTDQAIAEVARPDVLIKCICDLAEMPPDVANRLKKQKRIGAMMLRELQVLADRAIFSIRTKPSFMLSGGFKALGKQAWRVSISATVLPWEKEGNRPAYLCMSQKWDMGECRAMYDVLKLQPPRSEHRTVLVTKHVCKRIAKRGGVRGSHVAFISKSMDHKTVRFVRQEVKTEPLLTIFGHTGEALGYCPISECTCALESGGQLLVANWVKHLKEQRRWVLKTFLRPDQVKISV